MWANQVVKERFEEEQNPDLIIKQFSPGTDAVPDNKYSFPIMFLRSAQAIHL